MTRRQQPKRKKTHQSATTRHAQKVARREQEWGECSVCGQYLPMVEEVGGDMCGPCVTGDASTLLGLDNDD